MAIAIDGLHVSVQFQANTSKLAAGLSPIVRFWISAWKCRTGAISKFFRARDGTRILMPLRGVSAREFWNRLCAQTPLLIIFVLSGSERGLRRFGHRVR